MLKEKMLKVTKWTMYFMLAIIFFIFVYLITIKVLVYRNAIKKDVVWNDGGTCYLTTYVPYYTPYGGPGRVLSMFSNQSFFVVYDKDGKELRSSAWYFWKAQFSDLVAAEWHGVYANYPTSNGWDGWRVPECMIKNKY